MWQIEQLKYALGLSGLVSFYGVVALGVWLLGDRFGAGNTEKIVIIAIVLLTLPFALIIGYFATRKKNKQEQLVSAEAESQVTYEKSPKISAPQGEYDDLNKSAEEATKFLKNSGVDLYSLPWYLVAGVPKSGKTSLVLSSGLNFQNLPSQRASEAKFVRPTRNIDWRITNDAVFLDTAGRYQTEGIDEDEWQSLIEMLKKYRSQRPLDGFLLVISTEKILRADEREIESMAKILRNRLDEVINRTKIKFPVYLIFTHADTIEGFQDSFSVSQREGENLVWGATIPLEKGEQGQTIFDSEFENLTDSTLKRRLIRLSAPFPALRQLRIFNFPLHFKNSGRKIGHFVATLFRPNPFSQVPLLRGFYLTASPVGQSKSTAGMPTMQSVGKSYFTEKFFREVLLRDKNLAKTFIEQRQKPPILGWLLTILGAFLTLTILLMSGISLYKNKVMVEDASTKAESLITIYKADQARNLFTKSPNEVRAEITAIDELRQVLVDLDEYEINGAPFWMRFGLYSGNRIFKEKLLNIYFNAVEQRFKRPVVARLEKDLQKFASSNAQEPEEVLDKNFDYFSGYLMLSDGQTKKGEKYRKYAQGDFLAKTLSEFWKTESKLAEEYAGIAQQNLDFYAKQIDRDEFPRIPLKADIVDKTRKKLQAFPAHLRYYKREANKISKDVEARMGASSVATILTNNNSDSNFIEGGYQVPSAYTVEGYKLMKVAIRETDQKLSEDDWVMDEEAKKELAQSTDAAKVEERYFRDYADHWRNFVKNIKVKEYSKENVSTALQNFSSANSPIEVLLKEVVRQTNLSAKPKAVGWWDWVKESVNSLFEKKEGSTTGGNSLPEQEFRALFNFIGDETKTDGTPIARYRNFIGTVAKNIGGRSVDQLNQIAKDLAAEKDTTLKLRDAENNVAGLLGAFSETPSGQEVAELLKRPLGNLRSLLGADAQTQLEKTWNEQILPKARELQSGFPFDDSNNEADLAKLTAYLNPANGTLSKFYTERLEKYYEEVDGKLKVKESSSVKFSDEFTNYLNNAFALQKTLYGKEAKPNFEYDFKLNQVKDSIIEVTIDGQKIDSNSTGSVKFKFPATTGETGVFMSFVSTAEGSSTSGKPLSNSSANSSPTNVNLSSSNSNSATNSKFLQNSNNSNSSSGSSSLKFQGTWGLFKFFEFGSPKKQENGEYLLTYKLGGKTITATIKPNGGDLFDRNIFKTVKSPQKLLK